jgi:hypothetical protein
MSSSIDVSKEQYNIELANRQIEINDWSYNNKMDTLFVFQVLFISLTILSLLFYFKNEGFIGSTFVWYSFILLLGIFLLLLITRILYSRGRIDKRFWSRRRFAGDNATIPPSVTPGDKAFDEYKEKLESAYPPAGGSDTPSSSGECRCP